MKLTADSLKNSIKVISQNTKKKTQICRIRKIRDNSTTKVYIDNTKNNNKGKEYY